MTLLEKMAEAIRGQVFESSDVADHMHEKAAREAAVRALRAILTPTHAMVNRGGLKAFSGPQPEGGPPMIFPALMWREMLSYVIEERDRERPDEAGPEGTDEGGPEPDLLQGHPDHGDGEPADGPASVDQGRGDGAEG